jgi:hypothetical protein
MSKVFISGSISIKKLPSEVVESIKKIIKNNIHILVGDAYGIDSLIQDFCLSKNYTNLTVYSISANPRYKVSDKFNFKHIVPDENIKTERAKQQEKDKAMTLDSEFSFVIWDGKSKGSYANLMRALENNKKIKVYITISKTFLEPSKINKNNIEYIYRENNGYTGSEVVKFLKDESIDKFQKTQDLYKYLIKQSIIKKDKNIYIPTNGHEELFIIDKYRGKIKGIKFKNEFISWIENTLIENTLNKSKYTQPNLF